MSHITDRVSKFPQVLLQGRLQMALLFEGSKSEGMYPVLICQDGKQYRVHIRKATPRRAGLILTAWIGQHVALEGTVDDLRGHWRLVLEPDFAVVVVTQDMLKHDDGEPAP